MLIDFGLKIFYVDVYCLHNGLSFGGQGGGSVVVGRLPVIKGGLRRKSGMNGLLSGFPLGLSEFSRRSSRAFWMR